MTYYPDLSPYTYDSSDQEMLNVGWLSRDHPFNIGTAPSGLVPALVELAREPVNVQRGMHFCELCPDFLTARENTSRGDLFIGSGEIRVTGRQGIAYASPVMIVHYVEQHGYLPPADYCAAVLPSA
ncbi:DUF7919 family protein [Streptomyces sp. 8L]|uniref:DUF7919 family protein n=1 Tax=Streptomyces sp. 8L TaxID=2877242 RepID=UPI001CD69DE6|nr:hypothetical protein [Streptomyces sp. 8L]MCA1223021.1 hypothetical protein [Streptomyces sp. 8L]